MIAHRNDREIDPDVGRLQHSVCAMQHVRRKGSGAHQADERQCGAELPALSAVKVVAQEQGDTSSEHATGGGNSKKFREGKRDRFHERQEVECFV